MTAVMRIAEARLNASSISKSSIKLLFPGADVDCRTKTSAPRTFSLISTLLSPSLNVSTTALPNGRLRCWLIAAAKGGLELPANSFSWAIAFRSLVVCSQFDEIQMSGDRPYLAAPNRPCQFHGNDERRSIRNGAARNHPSLLSPAHELRELAGREGFEPSI